MTEKPTIYIETTIPSFLTARLSGDLIAAGRQLLTRQWWDQRRGKYRLFVSQYVLDEAAQGDADAARLRLDALNELEILEVDTEVVRLAQRIVATGLIPSKAFTDAAHIAAAARHGLDFLLTWNCAHIANAEISKKIRAVMAAEGYELPEICTPEEMFGGDENEG
ncbi:MAG: type II toxin-antitoxin system VapC family toxin [Kiritimatiellae bacterium]|nr:type II toxin-antitoxin system VapC family toxin [Kiritimatiellia bacterium]